MLQHLSCFPARDTAMYDRGREVWDGELDVSLTSTKHKRMISTIPRDGMDGLQEEHTLSAVEAGSGSLAAAIASSLVTAITAAP